MSDLPSRGQIVAQISEDPVFWITSGLPTIRELLYLMDASAFLGTIPKDEPMTSGLPVTREELRIPSCQGVTSTKSPLFGQVA
jgi:hypothetical protein